MVTTLPDSVASALGTCPVAAEVDARGLRCPLPLLRAKQAINALSSGESLRVWATDAGSWRDFHSWANLAGHNLQASEINETYCYVLRKK